MEESENKIQYFVTGTDTNVGKTIVSTILCFKLKSYYWKPIQTGALDASEFSTESHKSTCTSDTEFVSRWLGKSRTFPEGYKFHNPLSPQAAAECEGRDIKLESLISTYHNRRRSVPLIIEGAGGPLVPLNSDHLQADFIRILQIKTILVARTTLGTIHHTLASLEVLRNRNINVVGVIFVGQEEPTTVELICHHGGTRCLGQVSLPARLSRSWFLSQTENIQLTEHNQTKP